MPADLDRCSKALDVEAPKAFAQLLSDGYRYEGVARCHTDALGDYLEAVFQSAEKQRKVRATYLPAIEGLPERLVVLIEKTDQASFSVPGYLRWQKVGQERIDKLQLQTSIGSTAEKLRGVLDANATVINDNLSKVVGGKDWIDVPIDWAGHK